MSGKWSGSSSTNRRKELPHTWNTLRKQVLIRDGYRCRWIINNKKCNAHATDVDHINNNDDHSMNNLRALCSDHHGERTSKQGNDQRWKYREARPLDKHPGGW